MSVLLLRLEGPQQSYGINSKFNMRDTVRQPTKSAVLGILCAALGVNRKDLDKLSQLRENLSMGIRVDCEGVIEYDFHVAGGGTLPQDYIDGREIIKKNEYGVKKASGGKGVDSVGTVVSNRYFISDASFIVALESEDTELLGECAKALKNPHWPIFLGRKSFVPSSPLFIGIVEDNMRNILMRYPWKPWGGAAYSLKKPDMLRILIENQNGEEYLKDSPVSFEHGNRKFETRHYETMMVNLTDLEE